MQGVTWCRPVPGHLRRELKIVPASIGEAPCLRYCACGYCRWTGDVTKGMAESMVLGVTTVLVKVKSVATRAWQSL